MENKININSWSIDTTPDGEYLVVHPTAMGSVSIPCKTLTDATEQVKDYLSKINKIIERRKGVDEYCSTNEWTRSGT